MGFQDRDYYREEADWHESPVGVAGENWVVRLIVANVAIYFVDLFFASEHGLLRGMAVKPDTWAHPLYWWQFLTYGFSHSPDKIGHLLANMFGLWMFGRQVEGVLGSREFLRFYGVALAVGSLVWVARMALSGSAYAPGPPLLGASGAISAVLILFVCCFPHQKILFLMVIPLPAWVLGVVLVLSDLSGATSGGADGPAVAYDVHLAGAAFAFLYYRFRWNLGRLAAWRGGERWPLRRSPRLRVHEPSDDSGYDLESQYRALDEEADRILAKLHSLGDASLTEQERRILEDYSRRMRQKHR